MKKKSDIRLLAVASFGGHWVQLLRLKDLFDEYDVTYASCMNSFPSENSHDKYVAIPDVNADSHLLKLIYSTFSSLLLLLKVRPRLIVTTGALPGLILIIIGKTLFGSKIIWIDSMANADKLSRSAKQAKKYSDIFLTQWEHLASDDDAQYLGRVL